MIAKSVILVRFEGRDKYDFVGTVFAPWTDEMLTELDAREKTSFSEHVGLNAKFFVFTPKHFKAFLARTPVEKLGWNNGRPWDMSMVPESPPTTVLENDFMFILNRGLWALRDDAELFTFDQSASWGAETAFYGFIFDGGDHECVEGDGCISWEELLKRI